MNLALINNFLQSCTCQLNMYDTKQKVQPGEVLGGKHDVEYAAKVDNVSGLYSKYKKFVHLATPFIDYSRLVYLL